MARTPRRTALVLVDGGNVISGRIRQQEIHEDLVRREDARCRLSRRLRLRLAGDPRDGDRDSGPLREAPPPPLAMHLLSAIHNFSPIRLIANRLLRIIALAYPHIA